MPFKNKEEMRKQKRRFRSLQKLKNHDNDALMHCLSSPSGTEPVLARIVGINFQKERPTSPKKYSLHLSALAVDIEKYLKTLESMNFPYDIEFGHFYLIKRATKEEVQTFLANRTEKLKEFLSELKKEG